MQTITLELPSMYGDHHVVEVRRILLETPGVDEVYASSAFHSAEISFDPEKLTEDEIKQKLSQAGYLEEMSFAEETGAAVDLQGNGDRFYRHSQVFENTRQVVSFSQKVPFTGRPLWPCPGIGVLETKE
ncbi:MAG: heavy-metal-associated domain-containing protein [Anaerolineales bacterium]|jgi:copper chaperone CopZ